MSCLLWVVFNEVLLKAMRTQVCSVLLLLYMSLLTSSTPETDLESSTIKSALLNVESVLSTEPAIFHYPRTTEATVNAVGERIYKSDLKSDRTEQKIVPLFSNESTRHVVVYRDVRGVPYPSTSPKYPPQIPSYAPPSRAGFFTPPLPPEYLNPFADKPTLRGSNSESNSQNARRPIPPPPIFRPFESNKERVPLPPPDLLVPENKPSGKKALNTPSRPNSHQTLDSAYKDVMNNKENPARPVNDTDFDFVPILQYPSVSRILSGSSGRRHESADTGDRHTGPNSRHGHHNFEHMAKNLPNLRQELSFPPGFNREITPKPIPDIIKLPDKVEVKLNRTVERLPDIVQETSVKERQDINENEFKTTEHSKPLNNSVDTNLAIPQSEPPFETEMTQHNEVQDSNLQKINDKSPVYLWGVAWDIHVYLIACLFTLLSVYAVYNLILMKFYKHLLSYPYYISVHLIVAIIGILRAVYLFHDAYNITHSYPEPISHLLLNVTCPLITTVFTILFLFLVKTTDTSIFNINLFRHPVFIILVSIMHLGVCICFDLTTDLQFNDSGTKYLPLVCQCVYIFFCLLLGGTYLYVYKNLANSASRKQVEMFGTLYTTTSELNKTRPDALCFCIRITLATAMLILLMAVVQLYGIFGVPLHESFSFLKSHVHSMQMWIWWAYQFSVRVIEISICYLITWASTQKVQNEMDEKETNSQNSTTGFALFPCGPCRNNEETMDDIYPAVCNTNQAIHNYSLRTGKKVYDDAFPLNNMHGNELNTSQMPNFEMNFQDNALPCTNTYERRKKRTHSNIPWHLNPNQSNNYDEIGPGSEIIEIKDALTRKGLANINRSDSEASHNSHIPAHVSYESIGYHSGTFQSRIGVENNHFDDSNSEHGSNLSKNERFFENEYDSRQKKPHRDKNYVKKSGTLIAFPQNEKRKIRDGAQTLREDRSSNSPNSMLVDENGFVRFRSLADSAEQAEEASMRRSGHSKKSLPRRSDDRASR